MKRMKKQIACCLLLAVFTLPALAEDGAPASQFGFSGWPYRNNPCAGAETATPSPAPDTPSMQPQNTQTPSPTPDVPSAPPSAVPTATPTVVPTTTPTVVPTATPTVVPAATPAFAPTVVPTATPTFAPTAVPTLRPTAAPTPRVTAAPDASADVGDYTTLSVSAQEYSAWNLLNADRQAYGLPALPLDEELCAIARVKSCDMKTNGYFAHVSPTYGNAAAMLTYFGYAYQGVGENIAHHATVVKSQAAFMSSTGHRINILGSQWTRVGIGVCYDDNGFVYVTQLFAR